MKKTTLMKKAPVKKVAVKSPVKTPPTKAPVAFSCPKRYAGSVTTEVSGAIEKIATKLGTPVLVIFHGRDVRTEREENFDSLSRDFVYDAVDRIPASQPVHVILDSGGGDPRCSYQMAYALQDHCGSYNTIVPRMAKSAATLFALGSATILLGKRAELGPLDMQIGDHDTESVRSVLEYVQSLERLEAFALRLLDDAMQVLLTRTGKKVATLLPDVMKFSTDLVRPLFENVDVVQYTQMARLHKVVEDYAIRLMISPLRDREEAERIAHRLTSDYADHGFVIDYAEAKNLQLPVEYVTHELDAPMGIITKFARKNILSGLAK